MNILFRSDGSSQLGMGHMVRSMALAEELAARGQTVYFMVREDSQAKEFVDNKLFERLSYVEESDRKGFQKIIRAKKIRLFVSDVTEYSEDFFSFMRNLGVYTVQLDIQRKMDLGVDLIINGGIYAKELEKEALFYRQKALLGPKFNLLRSEYINAEKKEVKPHIENILITLGATDIFGLTEAVAFACRKSFMDSDIHVVYGRKEKMEESSLQAQPRVHLYNNLPRMLELMEKADLAICSGGITIYELSATATPSIVITQAENQIRQTEEFSDKGAILYFGKAEEFSKDNFLEILEFVKDQSLRISLSQKSSEIVDGKGVVRVADFLLSASIYERGGK